MVDSSSGQSELPPLDVPLVTPLTGGHLPLRELGISKDQDEEILDLTKITFDEVNLKIIQDRKKSCSRNPADPLSVTTAMNIVPNITSNPQMIAFASTTFVAATKHNIAWMSKQILDLQNRLYASEQRSTVAEQGKRKMEEENATLHLLHTGSVDFEAVVASKTEILGETMVVVYEEMAKLHHTIAPIVTI